MRLELLRGDLAVRENPGMDSTDPRFDEIVTLIQQGDFSGAANASEAIIADGIYDIRLIAYYLYGYFAEHELSGLSALLACLATLLENNWEAVGPINKRSTYAQNSLGWLFRQILKTVEFEERSASETWTSWLSSVNSEDVDAMLRSGELLPVLLMRHLEDNATPVQDTWSKLQAWLQNFQRLVNVDPGSVSAEGMEENGAEEAIQPDTSCEAGGISAFMAQDASEWIKGSYHLGLLKRKLDAFERLSREQQYMKASLLADDINETLANFDPKLYFPELFANYSLLIARNIGELAVLWDNRESVEWQAMKELLKVDLDGFVDFHE